MDVSRDLSLTAQLAEMERRWKWVQFWRSAGHTLLVLLLVLAAGAVVDCLVVLAPTQRVLLTAACYTMVVAFAALAWLRPFLRRINPARMAWLLERAVPEFNEKLISAVELSDEKNAQISMDLIHRVLQETETDLLRINPRGVFPLRGYHFALPALAVLLFAGALAVPPLRFGARVKRVAFPSAYDATVGRFDLVVLKPLGDKLPEGEPIQFLVRCSDPTIRHVEICMDEQRIIRSLMTYDSETGLFRYTIPEARRSITYWSQCGDVTSRKYDLEVLKRPGVEQFAIRYVFPEYMKLAPSSATSTAGDVKAYRGTRVELAVKSTKALSKMTVKWLGEEKDVALSVDGVEGRASFVIRKTGQWSIRLRDVGNLENLRSLEYTITALEDQNPTVTLERPVGNIYVEPEDDLELAWTARDDFGIQNQELRYSANRGQENILVLDPKAAVHAWRPGKAGPQAGDELEYYVRVFDGAGHHADSERRLVSMVTGRQLKKSGAFIAAATDLQKSLGTVGLRLQSVSNLHETVRTARRMPSGMEAENLAHNENLLAEQRQRMRAEMEVAEQNGSRVKEAGFFPRAQVCGELMTRTIQQGRVFDVSSITGEAYGDANVEAVAGTVALSSNMTAALLDKAREQIAWLEVSQMDQTLAGLAGATHAGVGTIRDRFIERARRVATARGSAVAESLRPGAAVPVAGLRGEYFDGLDRYVQEKDRAGRKPKLVRRDGALRFANTEAFGAGAAPFSVTWSGFIQTPKAGRYQFFSTSDDGSRVYVDGQRVVANDGTHDAVERSGGVDLEAGLHTLRVLYFNAAGGGMLALDWQAPGGPREPLPGSVLFEEHPDSLLAQMRTLRLETHIAANDFARLDQLAAEMRQQLQSLEEAVANLARELKIYDRAAEWDGVKAMAADLRKKADAEKDTEHASDLRLAAELLDQAADHKNADAVAATARALAEMERYQDLKEWKEVVDQGAAAAVNHLEAAEEKLEQPQGGPEAAKELERAQNELTETAQTPAGDKPMKDDPVTRPVAETLAAAAESARKASQDARENRPAEADKDAALVEKQIERAEKQAADIVARAAEERLLAREDLKRRREGSEGRLAELEKKMEPLAARVDKIDAENRQAVTAAADQVKALEDEVDQAASVLQAEARREVQEADGDVALARDKLALAGEMERIGRERLDAAHEALAGAAQRKDAENAANEERDRKQRAGQVAAAAENLRQAEAEMNQTRDLLARAEADSRRELPQADALALRQKLDELARKRLDPALQADLARVEGLREGEESLRRMAREADRLEAQPNREKASALARETEDVRDILASALKPDGQQALLGKADEVVQLAREALDRAMSDTRAFRAENAAITNAAGRQSLAERIKQRPGDLEPMLAKAEAMGALMGQPGQGMTEPLHKQVEPAMAQAAQRVAAQQNPDGSLSDALDGMKQIGERLDGYADALEAARQAGKTPKATSGAAAEAKTADLLPMQDRVSRMQEMMADARASETASAKVKEEISADERKAAWMLDRAAEGETDKKEKEKIEKAREAVTSGSFEQKAHQVEAVARMTADTNPDLAKKMEEMGKTLRADQVKANRADQMSRHADEREKQMSAEAGHLDAALAQKPDPALAEAQKTLDEFQKNLKREDLPAAEKNLDALEKTLGELYADAAREERKEAGEPAALPEVQTPAVAAVPAWTGGDAMGRLREALRAAPELRKAADTNLDWNARRGLMEIGADAMRAGRVDAAGKEAATAAAAADFDQAAAKTRGDARDLFQAAADSAQAAKAGKMAPPEFAQEQEDAGQQALAAARAAEFARVAQAAKDMDAARVEWNRADRKLNDLGQPFEDAFRALASAQTNALDKEEQRILAQQQAGFEKASLMDKAERLENAAKAVRKADPELKESLEKAAEAIRQDPKVKEAVQEQKKLASAAGEKMDALRKALDGRDTVAAERAKEALEGVRSAVKAGDHAAATQGAPAENLKDALQAMDPARPAIASENDKSLDAAAAAKALGNEDALKKAAKGDMEGAAASMEKLAKALPEQKARELAEQAAKDFREAREVAMESLPRKQADALRAAEAVKGKLAAPAAAALKQAGDAVRAGDLERASELMPAALAHAPAEAREPLKQLKREVDQAAKTEQDTEKALSEETRQLSDGIESMMAPADPVTRQQLQEAKKALEERRYGEAAEHMALASLADPEKAQAEKAMDLAGELARKDEAAYAGVSPLARLGLEELQKIIPAIEAAAKSNDYSRAADLARQADERDAAQRFDEAAKQQASELARPAQQGLAYLREGEKRAAADRKAEMQQAQKEALQGDLAEAEKLARSAAAKQAGEAAVAKSLEQASTYQKQEVAPLEKAVQEAAQNQLEHAAMSAERSEHGQPAAEQLQTAVEKAREGAERALKDGLASPDAHAQNNLAEAARRAMNNDLNGAVASAAAAGKAGEAAKAALEEARQAAEKGKAELQKNLEQARKGNEALRQAEQARAAAEQALKNDIPVQQKRQQSETENAQNLRQASQALDQNQMEQAGQLLAKTPAALALGEQMKALNQAMSQAAGQAEAAMQNAPDAAAKESLKQAAELARKGDAAGAQAKANAAGQAGQAAAQSLAAAASQKQSMKAQMQQAAEQATQQAADAATAARSDQERQAAMAQVGAAMKAGNLEAAATAAKDAAHGSYEAQRAAEMFAAAQKEPTPASTTPAAAEAQAEPTEAGEPATPAQAASAEAQQDMANALGELQMAQNDLASGQVMPRTSENLQAAAAAMNEAAQALAQAAMNAMSEGQPGAPTEGKNAGQYKPGTPGGGPGGRREKMQEKETVPETPEAELVRSWTGAEGGVESDDRKGHKMQYSDYYRKANRRYLERVQEETRQKNEVKP